MLTVPTAIILLRAMSIVPIDDAKMLEIVRRLVEAVNPDRIILFGSRLVVMQGRTAIWICSLLKIRMYRGTGERFPPTKH